MCSYLLLGNQNIGCLLMIIPYAFYNQTKLDLEMVDAGRFGKTSYLSFVHSYNNSADLDDDLADVVEAVDELAIVWEKFALKLHLKYDFIKVIKKNNPGDNEACLTEAMSEWLKENYNTARFDFPSWRTLITAVQDIDIALAQSIADRHKGIYCVFQGREHSFFFFWGGGGGGGRRVTCNE